MQIYIHRNNEDFGPYSREAVLEYLKQGVFQAYDYACYQGMSEWKTINDLLGIGATTATAAHTPGATKAAGRTTRSLNTAPVAVPPRKAPVVRQKKRTFMILVNLVLVALVGTCIYIKLGGGGEKGAQILDRVTNAITGRPTDETAAPVSAPVPRPVQVATPIPIAIVATPTPPPLPSTVHTTVPVKFPAVLDGKVVGSVSVPQGTEVKLIKAQADQLIVNYQGGMVRIARNLTDIDGAHASASGATAPTLTPSPESTPDPTDPDAALGAGGN